MQTGYRWGCSGDADRDTDGYTVGDTDGDADGDHRTRIIFHKEWILVVMGHPH